MSPFYASSRRGSFALPSTVFIPVAGFHTRSNHLM
jgi:hypothetical protein